MGEKIVVGPFNKGLRNDVTPFNIDNDSFPTLINSYQWRGRVKRKRGTEFLGRLTRFFNSAISSYGIITGFNLIAGAGNLLTAFSLQGNGNIVPGSVHLTDNNTAISYTDDSNGNLVGGTGGTIKYSTGAITIAGGGADLINLVSFLYYPDLPVMGLRDLIVDSTQFPGTLGFDTKYAYNISTASPYDIYDVSFYKNPPVSASLPGYVPKATPTATSWNGQDYQQFWTVNYQNALWETNGINVPFKTTNIGMQFSGVTNVAAPIGNTVVITVTGPNLIVGDFVYLNEFPSNIITGINFQAGYVTAGAAPGAITITLPNATLAGPGGATTSGIVQYLTNRSDETKDCLRWYDGDPTNGNATNPVLNNSLGWVNFAPPISRGIFGIADLPANQYYLIGAKIVQPFKDRLLFFGPVIQSSGPGNSPLYLQDTVIYSQNGTPYYTSSFTDPTSNYAINPTVTYNPILVPSNQTATPSSYFEDVTGFGGFISAGVDQEILTIGENEDVLIVGFSNLETRFVYSGNDILPFNFFIINSELGSGSTFSAITLDKGIISRGSRGFIITSQTNSNRIDVEIPDEVFEIKLLDNGTERVTAQRDYINEWIYMTYPVNDISYKFPTQTLQYNYRENTWAIFRECYTTYGTFRPLSGFTWATVGRHFPTWSSWNQPWNAGNTTALQPQVIGGNQQGFILIRAQGTNEGNSLYIRDISGSVVTSPDHCLNRGDYIQISDALGTVGNEVNNRIFSVGITTQNTFTLNPVLGAGLTYRGGGLIKRYYVPYIQTKQFPTAWGSGRKTRLGPQQYLLTTTNNSQITLLIFLSQDADNPYNSGLLVPNSNSQNNTLIYSTILYTCPESLNLGLTPANINLQMVTGMTQAQIWHRINTSLIGDTVQLGFTISDTQMRELIFNGPPLTITGATKATDCVLSVANSLSTQQLILINGVVGMTQLNGKYYNIIARSNSTLTIDVDSTAFSNYISGGAVQPVFPDNATAEIELHGMILDVQPSQVIA